MTSTEQDRLNTLKRVELANELLTCMPHRAAWRHAFKAYPKSVSEHTRSVTDDPGRPNAIAKARIRLALYRKQGREDIVALILQDYPELSLSLSDSD